MSESTTEGLVVYWRPLCGFCQRLLEALEAAGIRPGLHDIWEEPEAAEFVRSVNDGNEIVPTDDDSGAGREPTPPDQLVAHLLQA